MSRGRMVMLIAIAALSAGVVQAGPVASLDDVVFWTGAGANRAAVVIDFNGDAADDLSLVWGFRWDGPAVGRDMLDAVVAADDRLFAKISDELLLLDAVIGLGYDRNDDGQFQTTPTTDFDDEGVAYGAPIDSAAPVGGDWYREGWNVGFWHFGYSSGNPWTTGEWISSDAGAHSQPLVDGDWNSWAFTKPWSFPAFKTKFAQNPVIATPPGGHADFDADGDVDGVDWLAWQRGYGALGTAAPMDGDANGDGDVDAGDLASWQAAFGGALSTTRATASPEPGAAAQAFSGFVVLWITVSLLRRKA